jgi:hypothetical protein
MRRQSWFSTVMPLDRFRVSLELVEFVRAEAKRSPSDTDLHSALFGNGGRFGQFFPTGEESEAFAKMAEYEEIVRIRASLARRKRRSLA